MIRRHEQPSYKLGWGGARNDQCIKEAIVLVLISFQLDIKTFKTQLCNYRQEKRVGRTFTKVVVVLYRSFVLMTLLEVKNYYLLLLRIEHLYSFHDHLVFPVGGVASFFEAAICSYHVIFITSGMVDFGDTMLNKNVI